MKLSPLFALGAWLFAAAPAIAADLQLAVLDFDDASDSEELEPLGKGLQSMLTTDLAVVEGVTVVERARLQDLIDEMQLGEQGVLDPSTAAELGQTIGASHVVVGSFTVAGGTMRVDARLVDVSTSAVVASADASGERDAFFELEKELVKKLLAGLEAVPSAKERAAIARIHTADFDTFVEFSRGVAMFDAERYDEAIAVMERVSERDQDFRLAEHTLESYRELVAEARAKASAARIKEAEVEFAVRREQAAFDAEVVAWLRAASTDPDRSEDERASALVLLAAALGTRGKPRGQLRELRNSGDVFALARAGDIAFQQAWAQMRDRVPERNPLLPHSLSWWFKPDREHEASFENLHANAFGVSKALRDPYRQCAYAIDAFDDEETKTLWLDPHDALDARRAWLYDLEECVGGVSSDRWLRAARELAKDYRYAGKLDVSTAILEGLMRDVADSRELERLAAELEKNATFAQLYDHPDLTDDMREILLHHRKGSSGAAELTRSPLSRIADPQKSRWELHRELRAWGDKPYEDLVWIGETPVFKLEGSTGEVSTDRRTQPQRAGAIRYYGNDEEAAPSRYAKGGPPVPAFFVVGGVPRTDMTLSVTIDHRPADDWWPRQQYHEDGRRVVDARPTVGVLLGMVDISATHLCDPSTHEVEQQFPMRATALLIDEARLRLVELAETRDPDAKGCSAQLYDPILGWEIVRELDSTKLPKADRRDVRVTVTGTSVAAKIGGKSARFELDAPPQGFVGLMADGLGYAELSQITLE